MSTAGAKVPVRRPPLADGTSSAGVSMPDDLTIVNLLLRARAGDESAWHELVERYAPLVWSVCRRYRLSQADTDDVAQTVWLRLLEHIAKIREPAALPGWL